MKNNRLIVLGGFAGAGKTTITKRLAADFNYPFFSTDDFNAALTPILKGDFKDISPLAYQVTWHILKKNLRAGVNSILDMNMCKPEAWDLLDQETKDLTDTEVTPIILSCSLETHKARIEKRGKEDLEHFNLGGDKLEDVLHKYQFITNLDRPDVIRIDANDLIENVYRKVLEVLKLT